MKGALRVFLSLPFATIASSNEYKQFVEQLNYLAVIDNEREICVIIENVVV